MMVLLAAILVSSATAGNPTSHLHVQRHQSGGPGYRNPTYSYVDLANFPVPRSSHLRISQFDSVYFLFGNSICYHTYLSSTVARKWWPCQFPKLLGYKIAKKLNKKKCNEVTGHLSLPI